MEDGLGVYFIQCLESATGIVLILVLVEDGLGVSIMTRTNLKIKVLILVLVEDGLGALSPKT